MNCKDEDTPYNPTAQLQLSHSHTVPSDSLMMQS